MQKPAADRSQTAEERKIAIHPLTLDRWADFVRLFGEDGVGGGCWCMGWRLPRPQYLRQKGVANKRAMHAIVKAGPPPGVLAYIGGQPAGWCAVAPRETYDALRRSAARRSVAGRNVWSISCVYVARRFRCRHLSVQLIEAAAAYAAAQGARTIEGYPVPPKSGVSSSNYAYPGFESAFAAAGFTEMERRRRTRPIVRRTCRP